MYGVTQAFRRRTKSKCPICNMPMYMVYWRNNTHSFMCLKCHFGFNYRD